MDHRKSKVRNYLTHLNAFNGRRSEADIVAAIVSGNYHGFIQADRLRVAAYKIVMYGSDYKTEKKAAIDDLTSRKHHTTTAISQVKIRLNHLVMQLKDIKEHREEAIQLLFDEEQKYRETPEIPEFPDFTKEFQEQDEYFTSCFKRYRKSENSAINIEFDYTFEPLAELFPGLKN